MVWRWVKLQLHGKKPWWTFISVLADYACRQVRAGRKVAGQIKSTDVMNEILQATKGLPRADAAQQHRGPSHEHLYGTVGGANVISTSTRSGLQGQHPHARARAGSRFRIDFPMWILSWDDRHRRIIPRHDQGGPATKDLANKFGLSQGRISQLRSRFPR